MPNQNSLANLKPAWEKGETAPLHRSREVSRAITKLRHAAPEAVELCLSVMRDPNENSKLRTMVALAIINKVIPDQKAAVDVGLNTTGIQSLQIEFVSGEQVTIDRAKSVPLAEPESEVIDIEFEDEK